ncbi:hypothetical protein [Gramella sp. MAR_2010_147]|uniref:hypothetical protein n=1 Tax=Gramella sp. MAR_2010_147 TaxID=1250205 RepID=UPI00087AB6D6|nr:hypothetical protein [Gramella sp. MAR_2010_147]SDR67889.1 hypothetical protein SAMN04488553_0238 [Gramella sp. MAR_2010_147]
MLDQFIKLLPVFILELLAALAGFWYLKKTINPSFELKLLVGFLFFNFAVEILASYTLIAYYTEYEYFGFIKETSFRRNYWLYNIRNVLEYLVFILFFFSQLKTTKFKKVLQITGFLFIPAMILNLMISEVYFEAYSQFTSLVSTFMYVILIFRYFYEMLQSEEILNFYKSMPFYFSVAVVLWYLAITPFLIYSKFYEAPNMEFVKMQRLILLIMNIFMYSCFIFGFVYCSGKNNSRISLDPKSTV